MSFRIPVAVPLVGHREREALTAVLESGWIAPQGPEIEAFEDEIAAVTGRHQAVALVSGTAALHLMLRLAGIGPGDRVACASLTFAATANAVAYCGATPVFVDSDELGRMAPGSLAEACEDGARTGRPVRAVLAVDLFGRVCDYRALGAVAEAHGALLLSDAAESLGSSRDGRPAGSFGALAATSFNGNKIITTSAGGALLLDDDGLAARARKLAHQAREPAAHYEHAELGYTYRLSNVLAALGRAQLARLPEFIEAKRRHRRVYRDLASTVAGVSVFGDPVDDRDDNCWMTALRVDAQEAGISAGQLMERARADGIELRPMFKPMHLQPMFRGRWAHPVYGGEVSEALFATAFLAPAGAALSDAQVGEVCDFIGRECAAARRTGSRRSVS